MSKLDEFLKIGADNRPDSIAVVYTDITSDITPKNKRNSMLTAFYKDDYFDKEEIFSQLRKYRRNLEFLKCFYMDQYEQSILVASYHRHLYNLKYNKDWMEFLCEFNYKGMQSDR